MTNMCTQALGRIATVSSQDNHSMQSLAVKYIRNKDNYLYLLPLYLCLYSSMCMYNVYRYHITIKINAPAFAMAFNQKGPIHTLNNS